MKFQAFSCASGNNTQRIGETLHMRARCASFFPRAIAPKELLQCWLSPLPKAQALLLVGPPWLAVSSHGYALYVLCMYVPDSRTSHLSVVFMLKQLPPMMDAAEWRGVNEAAAD